MEALRLAGAKVVRISIAKPSLYQVYLEYTGKSIREEHADSRLFTSRDTEECRWECEDRWRLDRCDRIDESNNKQQEDLAKQELSEVPTLERTSQHMSAIFEQRDRPQPELASWLVGPYKQRWKEMEQGPDNTDSLSLNSARHLARIIWQSDELRSYLHRGRSFNIPGLNIPKSVLDTLSSQIMQNTFGTSDYFSFLAVGMLSFISLFMAIAERHVRSLGPAAGLPEQGIKHAACTRCFSHW